MSTLGTDASDSRLWTGTVLSLAAGRDRLISSTSFGRFAEWAHPDLRADEERPKPQRVHALAKNNYDQVILKTMQVCCEYPAP